ncbi:LapB repeat-containing protein [Listeria sp. ILCC792]|uniref:LapB repeat-containing protein n=1 Tax=Listeria sp. ILCC792 TaxID=1918331 RepID=UPI000B58AB5A|nr:LapB repeat-containing protein [Listeria sp. ILCC792]
MAVKQKALTFMLVTTIMAIPFVPVTVLAEEPIVTEQGTEIVQIPDLQLKKYLNTQLRQAQDADITQAQLNTLRSVSLSGDTYTNLSGLEHANNLTALSLSNTSNIADLSTVTAIPSLTNLTISGAFLTDDKLPDLNNVTNLESVSLSNTSNTNAVFSKINKMPNVANLYVQNNYNITDISALKSMPKLKVLFVQFDGIQDLQCISEFPALESLAATGQNTGRLDAHNKIKSSVLSYDEANQTVFIPFSMMVNRFTHFNGYQPPFTKSTASNQTFLAFNDTRVDNSRLSINDEGITVNAMTKEDFDNLSEIEYNAFYDNAAGSYATPTFLQGYNASSGTYDQYFDIEHFITLTADEAYEYDQNQQVTEAQFLQDVHATTDDGSPVTSNFAQVVDLTTPGVYEVTLNAENEAGLKATPVKVQVTVREVAPAPVDPTNPEQPVTPATPITPTEPEKPETSKAGEMVVPKETNEQQNTIITPKTNTEKPTKSTHLLPKTGDTNGLLYVALGGLLVLGGFALFRRKRISK